MQTKVLPHLNTNNMLKKTTLACMLGLSPIAAGTSCHAANGFSSSAVSTSYYMNSYNSILENNHHSSSCNPQNKTIYELQQDSAAIEKKIKYLKQELNTTVKTINKKRAVGEKREVPARTKKLKYMTYFMAAIGLLVSIWSLPIAIMCEIANWLDDKKYQKN